ncbi:putative cytoplasmic protein [Dethiosulfovibrio peptidovorans DSM 11002]|uniref:Cytoplasmic protein n=1 Tax=Dethiosulfovibrio peptidovorans DSM 11002 TaxID=469381 RepID=D2Z7W0_9BACT|nr:Wadjet anti-phage system protein JetD domain-containing protein [Dethiosulfovibrio peptidovorans]EFC91557.1 putative cytoplasmic protein [Dethiosulfovibrio peptidovorans DSM 11002]
MAWTTPEELRSYVQRLWDRGVILGATVVGESLFPRRLPLKKPTSGELSGSFDSVRRWISLLSEGEGDYRVEWRTVNHRILGENRVPFCVWVDSLEDALSMIGKKRAFRDFSRLVDSTEERCPQLISWIARRPLQALALYKDWSLLLDLVEWMIDHPRPSIYVRQVDLPGVHSKFIEGHRSVLSELFDLVLSRGVIDQTATGASGFCHRYGFREKPRMVRFRVLDSALSLPYAGPDQDVTLTKEAFARLDLDVSKVFITENEVNFLAFPRVPGGMVIFGAGYGFDNLSSAVWLRNRQVFYWGDLDTHGFAILNQFRSVFPRASSFLMDQETLLRHRAFWGLETRPEICDLPRLTEEENALYRRLVENEWGDRIRLEQEHIGFGFLIDGLRRLGS